MPSTIHNLYKVPPWMQDHRHRHNSIKGMIMQVLPKLYTASSLIFFTLRGLGTQFLVIRQPLYFPKKNWLWRITKSMDFVPSILFQYSLIDNEVYDLLEVNILLKVNMRIEKCEEGTEWTEQGRNH